MTKETFLDAVRRRFLEDIREAYLECAHGPGKPIDEVRLTRILGKLKNFAKKAGLTPDEFEELTMICLPGVLSNVIAFERPERPVIRPRRAA
ncbi:MAG: hypothetical protein JNL01_16410 [Bdellovibrionales bacterium]|nr:hypothetical protein [Bdellovibrionales bacterium]